MPAFAHLQAMGRSLSVLLKGRTRFENVVLIGFYCKSGAGFEDQRAQMMDAVFQESASIHSSRVMVAGDHNTKVPRSGLFGHLTTH
eukprot:1549925-Amphidinium_carterae.1